MIELIILIIILVAIIINFTNVISLIWYNDYFKKNYDICYITNNISLFEMETYRNKLSVFLYSTKNNKLKIIQDYYVLTYYIIIALLIILIILSLVETYNNRENLSFTIFKIVYLIIFYKVGDVIINKINKINELKYKKNEQIYKYNLVFKILNSLLYLNDSDNIFNEVLEYSTNKYINNKNFDEILSSNIASIYGTSNQREINYIKSQAITNLDYLKYINLNEISPFYFKKYFENIYVIINKSKYYLNDISYKDNINSIIKDNLIKSGETNENIENIDFVEYFKENKDLIFQLKNIKGELIDNLNSNYYIYVNIILALVFIIIFLHILYIKFNSSTYLLILFIIKILLAVSLWIKFSNN
jgi:hypothetical protein